MDWSTLLLFGGGLSLGSMMFDSGLARALGQGIFDAMPLRGTYGIALAATVACSFGFMLPVSTPPNALVFATGRLRIREMVAYGAMLDLGGILLVSAWVTLFA